MKNTLTKVAAWTLVTPFAFAAPINESVNQALPDMVVTGGLAPISVNQFGGSLTVITAADIAAAQSTYLSDLLRQVPGFTISQSGGPGTQTQLRVRGSEANHVLVLVDGVRVNDPTAGDEFLFNYALLDNVERIEVIRGPQSAIWGTDAVAAVINIITKSAEQDHWGFDLSAGSFNSQQLAVSGGLAQDRWRLDAGVNALDSAGSNISRQGSEEDGFENLATHVKWGWDVSDAVTMNASLNHSDAMNEFDGTDFVVTGLPTDADLWTERTQTHGQLAMTYTINEPWWTEFALQRAEVDADNFTHGLGVTSATSATTDEYRFGSHWAWGASQQQRLSLVVDHRAIDFSQRGDASPFGDPNQDQSYHVTGVAAEFQHALNEQFSWQLSARHDAFNRFEDVSNLRLAAVYHWSEGLRLHASYGTGSKAPSFIERFGFFPANFVGNPNLQPEESAAFELGLEQQTGGSSWSLVYFNQDLTNEINGFVFDAESGLFTAANQPGKSERQGVELTFRRQWTDQFSTDFNYTHTDASEPGADGAEVEEVRRPADMASVRLNYRFADDRAHLFAQVNHQGDQLDLFFDPLTFTSSQVKLDAHTTVDLTFNWQLTDQYQLYVKGQNIFDESYEEVLGYARPGTAYTVGFRGRF